MSKRRGNHEGSIYQDSAGRWRAAVDLGYRNGKRARKLLSGQTRAEVAGKLTTVFTNQQLGIPVADDRQRVGPFLDRWLQDVAAPKVRPKTLRTYSDIVRQHLNPALGKRVLTKLTPQDVRACMRAKTDEGLSPGTVRHIRNALRIALNVAVRDGLIVRNVAALVEPPRLPRTALKVLGPEEARAFLETIRGHRLEALFIVALSLGLRESEVLGLRWLDVDLENSSLSVGFQLQRVAGKLALVEPKTEKSRRTISLPLVTTSALAAHRARQEQERAIAGSSWTETGMVFTTTIGSMLDQRNLLRAFYALFDPPKLKKKPGPNRKAPQPPRRLRRALRQDSGRAESAGVKAGCGFTIFGIPPRRCCLRREFT